MSSPTTNIPTQPPVVPNVQVPLTLLLDLVIGIKDHGVFGTNLSLVIQSLDKEEIFCHVEWPDDYNKLTEPRIWRIDPWRVSYTKTMATRRRGEIERQLMDRKRSKVKELTLAIVKDSGLPENFACMLATNIMNQSDEAKKLVDAKQFGVDATIIQPTYEELKALEPEAFSNINLAQKLGY